MPDYSKSKIYCIRNPECDEVYIGSTTETLNKRLQKHISNHTRWKKGTYHYVTSFKLFEVGTPTIELIEEYPCESKIELDRREGEIIRITENCVNKVIPGRTKKEYHEDNKDRKREYDRERYAKLKAVTCQSDDTLHSSQQNDPSIMLNASS